MELWDAFEKRRTIRKFSAPPGAQQLKRLLKPIFRKQNKKNNDCKWLPIRFLRLHSRKILDFTGVGQHVALRFFPTDSWSSMAV